MFVALKNWRERLKHQSGDHHPLLVGAERLLKRDAHVSTDLLRQFRSAALARNVPSDDAPSLGELGPQFVGAEPLPPEQNLSIMASVERGAALQVRHKTRR
jgi:hypothetical protein